MKRLLPIILCALMLLGCAAMNNPAEHERFTIDLPEGWERVDNSGVVCYAKGGNPVRSSNITFYATDKNYYFDKFTLEDYAAHVNTYSQYEQISAVEMKEVKVDGWNAHRVVYSAVVDQADVTIVMYAIDADMTYMFTLLQMNGEAYTDAFDEAMKTIEIHNKN